MESVWLHCCCLFVRVAISSQIVFKVAAVESLSIITLSATGRWIVNTEYVSCEVCVCSGGELMQSVLMNIWSCGSDQCESVVCFRACSQSTALHSAGCVWSAGLDGHSPSRSHSAVLLFEVECTSGGSSLQHLWGAWPHGKRSSTSL